MRTRFFKLAIAGACLLLVAGAAACGDGEEEAPIPTPVFLTPLPPQAMPTVDASVPLVEYRSPDGGFSVSHPDGWTDLRNMSGPDFAVFSWTEDGIPIAQLTVLCNRGENQTVDSLIAGDAAISAQFSGGSTSDPVPIEVAGTSGKQVTYARNVSGLTVEQVAAFVVTGDCGWRIGLDTYVKGSLQSYLPLFERILASFQAG